MPSTKGAARAVTLISTTLILAGCETMTGSVATKPAPDPRATCAAWEPIRWSGKDTDDTIRQAKGHNATGRALGCW